MVLGLNQWESPNISVNIEEPWDLGELGGLKRKVLVIYLVLFCVPHIDLSLAPPPILVLALSYLEMGRLKQEVVLGVAEPAFKTRLWHSSAIALIFSPLPPPHTHPLGVQVRFLAYDLSSHRPLGWKGLLGMEHQVC